MANTEAAEHARAAAELLDLPAAEARDRVRQMDDADELDRAERAERDLGKGRTTVLRTIEEQRSADGSS